MMHSLSLAVVVVVLVVVVIFVVIVVVLVVIVVAIVVVAVVVLIVVLVVEVVLVGIKNSLFTHFPPGPHEISSTQFIVFKEDCFIQTPLKQIV